MLHLGRKNNNLDGAKTLTGKIKEKKKKRNAISEGITG